MVKMAGRWGDEKVIPRLLAAAHRLTYNARMRQLFLCDCQAGDMVEDVFVLTNKQLAQASNGKHYIKAFISDRSTQITARMWNATRDIFSALPESGFVRVRGRVENYQNNLQIIIEQLWPAKEGSYVVSDLLPHTLKQIEPLKRRLAELLGTVQNRYLTAIVQTYLNDEALMTDFHRAPAAQTFHHAFLGGLLEHTLNAMEVANAAVAFYPALNRELILVGLFLHDIAKTWELKYETAFGYTDGGHLIGHIVKGAIWLEEKAKDAAAALGEPIPRNLIDVLQHIILSHHEKPEFGAARVPATPEAWFISMIDNMDAKMMLILQACRGENGGTGEGNWTEYMKAMGVRLYRPDVACAELPEALSNGSMPDEKPASTAPVKNAEAPAGPTLKLVLNNPLFESFPGKKK
jgi:3'-5' exoribonuclease